MQPVLRDQREPPELLDRPVHRELREPKEHKVCREQLVPLERRGQLDRSAPRVPQARQDWYFEELGARGLHTPSGML